MDAGLLYFALWVIVSAVVVTGVSWLLSRRTANDDWDQGEG